MHPDLQQIYELYLGQMGPETSQPIKAHLSTCAKCRDIYSDYGTVEAIYEVAEPLYEPSAMSITAIQKMAYHAVKKEGLFEKFWVALTIPRLSGAVAILALILIGYWQYPSPSVVVVPVNNKLDEPISVFDVASSFAPNWGGGLMNVASEINNFPAVPTFGNQGKSPPRFQEVGNTFSGMLGDEFSLVPNELSLELAQNFERRGLFENANLVYERLYDKTGATEKAPVLYYWALCLAKMGQTENASQKLSQLQKTEPNWPGLADALKILQKK